jgi:hypothetical protein
MSRQGQLRLDLLDVYGNRLQERVDVFLRHQTLTEVKAARHVDASRSILISGLRRQPHGLYRLDIDPPSYLPVRWFVDIASGRVTERTIVFPVDPSKIIRVAFPDYDDIPHAHALLEASGSVLDFGGRQGRELYESLDDIRRAGLLNIIAKSRVTTFRSEVSVLTYLQELTELRGDRFFAHVPHELRENVKNSVQDDLFSPVDGSLHRPPDGYELAGSFKTPDPFGNLQLTFFARGDSWVADVDIDDAQGLGHVFQVMRNAITGRPTHPFDIHQILLHRQQLDPGYRFVLYEDEDAAPAAAAPAAARAAKGGRKGRRRSGRG